MTVKERGVTSARALESWIKNANCEMKEKRTWLAVQSAAAEKTSGTEERVLRVPGLRFDRAAQATADDVVRPLTDVRR
jgi:hypothetical protein